ncbi:MAG TPA: hypothetical protein VHE33_15785, partial [Acidobacteriaceae bacterium]|nr:hypothetical protein [Acidobacteriaceae bacterium]
QRWRLERRMRMGYDGGKSTRPELGWTQRNFICAQMMIEERDFYDPEKGVYTVELAPSEMEKVTRGFFAHHPQTTPKSFALWGPVAWGPVHSE